MTTLADALSEDIVELITGSDRWLSLHTADPGKTGASEATAAITARIELDTTAGWDAAEADAPTGGRKQVNAAELDFGDAIGTATLTHAGIWTAVSGGTFLAGAELITPQAVVSGNPVIVPAGDLEIVGAGIS